MAEMDCQEWKASPWPCRGTASAVQQGQAPVGTAPVRPPSAMPEAACGAWAPRVANPLRAVPAPLCGRFDAFVIATGPPPLGAIETGAPWRWAHSWIAKVWVAHPPGAPSCQSVLHFGGRLLHDLALDLLSAACLRDDDIASCLLKLCEAGHAATGHLLRQAAGLLASASVVRRHFLAPVCKRCRLCFPLLAAGVISEALCHCRLALLLAAALRTQPSKATAALG